MLDRQEDNKVENENGELRDGRTPSKSSTDSEETSSSENLKKFAQRFSVANWREGEQYYVRSTDEPRGIASLLCAF